MSESRTRGRPTFHVVCHDCSHERLVDCRDEASTLVDDHVAGTNHAVEFDRIA